MASTVLVADAQPLFSEVLSIRLQGFEDLIVLEERPNSGLEAVEAVISLSPDVALLDYWMPDFQGPQATRTILNWAPERKVILLSWLHGPPHIRAALEAGAAGFLPKSLPAEKVAEAVRLAAAGERLVFAQELGAMVRSMDERHSIASKEWAKVQPLTARELQILGLLSLGRSPEDIAARLFVAPGTVNDHIHNIIKKLGVRSSSQAVAFAHRVGLVFTSETTKFN